MARKIKSKGDGASEPESEAPSCLLKSLPEAMLVAAAEHAVEVNPVNAPMLPQQMLASVHLPEAPQFLALLTTKYWGPRPRTLSVQFLDTPNATLRKKLLSYMNAWSKSGCIKFAATTGRGDVRLTRDGSGYWSYMGTDILLVPRNQPTMCLQSFTAWPSGAVRCSSRPTMRSTAGSTRRPGRRTSRETSPDGPSRDIFSILRIYPYSGT
jgi:hypothetical protein